MIRLIQKKLKRYLPYSVNLIKHPVSQQVSNKKTIDVPKLRGRHISLLQDWISERSNHRTAAYWFEMDHWGEAPRTLDEILSLYIQNHN